MLRSSILLVILLAACGGDNKKVDDAASGGRVSAEPADTKDTKADGKAPDKPAVEPAVPLVEATAVLPGKTKVDANLGFKLETVAGLHALEGVAVVPTWGVASDADPSATRDDDLLTAWTCTATADNACAVGLSLSAVSHVAAVRLYATAGPDWRDLRAHPRPKLVRVHTDVGYVDAKLDDSAAHAYVMFETPVKTRTIAVEVLDVYKGGKDALVHIAELEAFGPTGPARPPMVLDPATVFVSYETEAWKAKGGSHTIRLAFLDALQADGKRRRLMRGTALFGVAGDRFVLVEKLHSATCDAVKGGWVLLDLHTRVPIPVGELGGAGGAVRRHPDGTGFLVESPTGDDAAMRAVLFDAESGKLEKKRPFKGKSDDDARTQWGFADAALDRGGQRFDDPPPGCRRGADAADVLDKTIDKTRTPAIDPSAWLVCDLADGSRGVIGRGDACGTGYSLYHVAATGSVTAVHADAKVQARGLRLATIPGVGLVVETTEKNGARGRLWQLDATGVHELFAGASLAVRPPAGCGSCEHDELLPAAVEPALPTVEPDATDGGAPPPDDAATTGPAALPSEPEPAAPEPEPEPEPEPDPATGG